MLLAVLLATLIARATGATAYPSVSAADCAMGTSPFWRAGMLAELPRFGEVFGPAHNDGGTGFFHAFALWFLVRRLQPLHIVESGARLGLGTWILRQAAPYAQLIVVSPEVPSEYHDAAPSSRY
jgi:hypothetical protein